MKILVATEHEVLALDPEAGKLEPTAGLEGRAPTCLSSIPGTPRRAWCGTHAGGVFRSDDGGASWRPAGLAGKRLMAVAASPAREDLVWAGTEPSELWRSDDGGERWERLPAMEALPSSEIWSFPPRPETHHVRWIACHPSDAGRLWVAIEAGALVSTGDGGRSWSDRVAGGPYDTHELAVHPSFPDVLRVAAGDGYYESGDGGANWESPDDGLEVGYLRSVAVAPDDPETVVISASSGPRSAYAAGRSDGRLYRRSGRGPWERVRHGWPDPPSTIAPLLAAGAGGGELWAADERGVHRSGDRGRSWTLAASYAAPPRWLRGIALLV